MINKHQLDFDPSETDCDQVGAFLKSSDGTLLTHTTFGAVEALDVNIANTGNITIDGEVSLDAATLAALETVTVQQGTSPWVIGDGGGSITVDGVDFDIRNLTHVSDSMKIGDGTDFLVIESDGSINVNSSEAGFSSCAYAAISVGNTATDLVATELVNRKTISIQNLGNKPIYIGCDSSVTKNNGTKVPKGATAEFRLGAGIDVHAITNTGTSDVRIIELA